LRAYTLIFLSLFLEAFLPVFLVVHAFLALCLAIASIGRLPELPVSVLMAGVPNLLLPLLPTTIAFTAVVAGVLFTERLRAADALLLIASSGRDPRRYTTGVLAAVGAMCVLLFWLTSSVIPVARYEVRRIGHAFRDDPAGLAVRLARDTELVPGFRASFGRRDGDTLSDFSLVAENPGTPLAVTADRVRCEVIEDGRFLRMDLSDGRLLRADRLGNFVLNLSFARFRLLFDTDLFLGKPKEYLLDAKYYTSEELDRLPEQISFLSRRGILLPERRRARMEGLGAVRWCRIQSSITPLLLLVLLLAFLGTEVPTGRARRIKLVLLVSLLLVLPEQLVLSARARKHGLDPAWLAFLPTLQIALVLLGTAVWTRLRRREA